MKKSRAVISLFLGLILVLAAPLLRADHPDVKRILQKLDDGASYKEVKEALDKYAKENPKAKGIKQLYRVLETRLAPLSPTRRSTFDPTHVWHEWKRYENSIPQRVPKRSLAWRERGPWNINNVTSHWAPGIGRVDAVAQDPQNPNVIYAGMPAGGLWKSADGGTSWLPLTDHLPIIGVADICVDPNDPATIYIATGDKDTHWYVYSIGVLKTTDGGASWNTTGLIWQSAERTNISKMIIHPTNSNILYAACQKGLHKTINGGATWSIVLAEDCDDVEFKPGDPNTLYVITEVDREFTGFFKTTDGGNSFQQTNVTATGRAQIAVTDANPAYVYFMSVEGIYRSADSGQSFTKQGTYPGQQRQVWYDLAMDVSDSDAQRVFVGEVEGYLSTNGGQNFSRITSWTWPQIDYQYIHCDIHIIKWIGDTLWVGTDGLLAKSTDGGHTFTYFTGYGNRQFYRIGGSRHDLDYVVGGSQDNGTSYMKDGVWLEWLGADGFECIVDWGDPTNQTIYGCIQDGGGPYYSSDGAASYSSKTAFGVGDWLTPYLQDPNNASTFYVGTTQVKKSTNGMSSWTTLSNFGEGEKNEYIDGLAVAPSDSNYIYASKDVKMWRTTNGGTSWTEISGLPGESIMYISTSYNDPKKVAITFWGFSEGEKIYLSTDAGDTWTNISNGLPNLPARCVIFHNGPEDGMYLSMEVGVYYRDDNMNRWYLHNQGLPNVLVSELEIFYPGNILRAATFGRGLWEGPLVVPGLHPDFTVDVQPYPNPKTVVFKDTSTSTAIITSWHWNFGDGSTSSQQHPTHTYSAYGNFNVQLTVSDDSPESDTVSQTISIVEPYPINAHFTSIPRNLTVQFTDESNTSATIQSCQWNFGDGNQSSQQNPVHTFDSPGTYPVTLTVTDNFPSTSTKTLPVTVTSLPQNYCEASNSNGYVRIISVKFGEVDHASAHEPTNDFTHLSSAVMKGESYEISVGTNVNFDTNSAGIWIDWNQDGDFEDTGEEVYSQTQPGPYQTTFTVPTNCPGGSTVLRVRGFFSETPKPCGSTGYGETEDYSVTVIAPNTNPVASFNWSVNDKTVHFIDTSSDPDGSLASWQWEFGDGSSSSQQNPTHTYSNPNPRNVTLTVNDNQGNSDSVTNGVTLGDQPDQGGENFVGNFAGAGVWMRDSGSGNWSLITREPASQLVSGDIDGNGVEELIGVWSFGIYIRYANGTWERVLDSDNLVWLAAGDMNGDGRDDILGSWSFGIYFRDSQTQSWTKLHSQPATMVDTADFDGDSKDDLLGIWPSIGIWTRSATGTWTKILSGDNLIWLTTGDMNADGRMDILGSWTHGTWTYNPMNGQWTKLHVAAQQVASGDLDGDGADDLIGTWNGIPGVWTRYLNGQWEKLHDTTPTTFTTLSN